jgi:hypothetical protein
MLEREDLAAIAHRRLRQQPQFGQAVDHHARRADLVDLGHDQAQGFAQFHFAGVQQRLFLIGAEAVGGDHLGDADAVERPAVALRDRAQLHLGFRERHVQGAFAPRCAFEREAQAEGGLAGAGRAFHQIEAFGRQPAGQDVIEATDTRRDRTEGGVFRRNQSAILRKGGRHSIRHSS